jgi:hypothetical protein
VKSVPRESAGNSYGDRARVLARHYGFTEEELDFIINYGIKYRMGCEFGELVNESAEADSPEDEGGEA